jgi:hypothetical protein
MPFDGPQAAGLRVALEVSADDATPGSRIAIAIRTEGVPGLGAHQGTFKFDASRLVYLGQIPNGSTPLVLNDSKADRGELYLLAWNAYGFTGRSAILAFEVKAEGYTQQLDYNLDVAGTIDLEEITEFERLPLEVSPDLTVPEDVEHLSPVDWMYRLYPAQAKAFFEPDLVDVEPLTPGDSDLYGDVNANGVCGLSDGLDPFFNANAIVGNRELIGGTSSNLDIAVAGDVNPTGPPVGNGIVNGLDNLAIAREAVDIPQAVVCDPIPKIPDVTTVAPDTIDCSTGSITSSLTIPAGRVTVIKDVCFVEDVDNTDGVPVELIIEPGAWIEGIGNVTSPFGTSAIVVTRTARLIAEGTRERPITMTCTDPTFSSTPGDAPKGCWGGLVVLGNSLLNSGSANTATTFPERDLTSTGGLELNIEGIPASDPRGLFGGDLDSDSSGVIRYLRIFGAGFKLADANELNCLTMGGVGSGTVIDHVMCVQGLDDAFENFGGSVSLKYLVARCISDDKFDVSFGHRGAYQFLVNVDQPDDSDHCIEADNSEPGSLATPLTETVFANMTCSGSPTPTDGGSNDVDPALRLREGTKVNITHSLIMNQEDSFACDKASESCGITMSDGGGNCTQGLTAGIQVVNTVFGGNVADGADTNTTACATTWPNYNDYLTSETTNTFTTSGNAALVYSCLDPAGGGSGPWDCTPVAGGFIAGLAPLTPADQVVLSTAVTYPDTRLDPTTFPGAIPPRTYPGPTVPEFHRGWTDITCAAPTRPGS